MKNILNIIDRNKNLFEEDIFSLEKELEKTIGSSSFLVIGGAGSIGQSVTTEIFKRNPKLLHVIDISENNLVELVRNLRSSIGYQNGEFKTYAIDCSQPEYDALINYQKKYDYILNLSALKHVRSEKDPFTLMRMIQTNILNTIKTYHSAQIHNSKKYFCVSTDKAANPVNLMGATKRIMELCLSSEYKNLDFSMSRFANVAFSDGSLLHGFNQRFLKQQPLSAPTDTKRYFVTPQESGELCLLSAIFGNKNEIFFSKRNKELKLTSFSDIAINYITSKGYEPYICDYESEAREKCSQLIKQKKWPLYLFQSDTTGEKSFEEFYTKDEEVDFDKFDGIGIVKNKNSVDRKIIENFYKEIDVLIKNQEWTKLDLLKLIKSVLPKLDHEEKGKYLDSRM